MRVSEYFSTNLPDQAHILLHHGHLLLLILIPILVNQVIHLQGIKLFMIRFGHEHCGFLLNVQHLPFPLWISIHPH